MGRIRADGDRDQGSEAFRLARGSGMRLRGHREGVKDAWYNAGMQVQGILRDTARPRRMRGLSVSFEERTRIDARLAALGRGLGALRLRLGEGLLRLDAVGGAQALGFPTFESYCAEALERSGRWGADARSLARRLAGLPRLRAALVEGRLGWAMVELLARVATEKDEADWIEAAAHSTVRAMRLRVKAPPEEVDERAAWVTISRTVDRIVSKHGPSSGRGRWSMRSAWMAAMGAMGRSRPCSPSCWRGGRSSCRTTSACGRA